jgi:glycosyl hydrolase family 10
MSEAYSNVEKSPTPESRRECLGWRFTRLNEAPRSSTCACMKAMVVIVASLATLQAKPATVSFNIEVPDRVVTLGSEFSITVEVNGFQEMAESSRAAIQDSFRFKFPGLVLSGKPSVDSEGRSVVRGRVNHPGFFPFEVSFMADGLPYSRKDYVVALPPKRAGAFDHVGYYGFLARGDYGDETHKLALWRLEDWEDLIAWMEHHKVDTLFLLVNGYTLGYPSAKFLSLRDPFSLNVRYNFLGELINFAHTKGVKVYLTFTTDDHAEEFGKLHPETVRVNRDGYKTSPRALCLENKLVQEYIFGMFEEVLTMYGNADGVVIHPTEEDPDRFNEETKDAYTRETGKQLATASKSDRYRWYNQKYAAFLVQIHRLITAKNPKMDFIMFNCWWQDEDPAIYEQALPKSAKICVWYYGWDDKEFHKWPIFRWVAAFGPERILYMPAGVAFMYPHDPQVQMERHIGNDRLISTATALGVKSCVYFAGWDVGTERDRLRDLLIALFPTIAIAPDRSNKFDLIEKLYEDYFAAREALLK